MWNYKYKSNYSCEEDGTVVAEASRPSKFLSPGPDMQEQDANEWWDDAG